MIPRFRRGGLRVRGRTILPGRHFPRSAGRRPSSRPPHAHDVPLFEVRAATTRTRSRTRTTSRTRTAAAGGGGGRDADPAGRTTDCGVLHIGGRLPRGPTPGYPHDSAVLTGTSISSARAPMCRQGLSAHGRISTALNAGEFPHDSADPPPAGSDRMCSTASTDPMPHIRLRQHRPSTANTSPVRPAAAREDGFCTPRGPALAFWEDRSGPPPEDAAHEPRNYAETGGSVRRVGANDPPKTPFPRPPPAPVTDT